MEEIRAGIDEFNRGRFWHAHEGWELAWRAASAGPEKEWLQAMIQVAAVLVHLEKGREDPARRLALSALRHMAAGAASGVEIAGAAEFLERVLGGAPLAELLAAGRGLRAGARVLAR